MFDKVINRKRPSGNILAFVPSYNKDIDFGKEILEKNKTNRSSYSPLPAAIEEAEYIHNLLGGELLTCDEATEKNFKKLADLAQNTNYTKVYVNDISKIDIDKYYTKFFL